MVAEGSLWVTIPLRGSTLRVDPATGEVEQRFPPPGIGGDRLRGRVHLDGGVDGRRRRFHGERRGESDRPRYQHGSRRTPLVLPLGVLPRCGGRRVRVDGGPDERRRLQDRPESARSRRPNDWARARSIGSFSDGVVWVGNSDVGTVVGIDAITGARRTFPFEHPVQGRRGRLRRPARHAGAGADLRGRDRRARREGGEACSPSSARLAIPDPAILERAGVLGGVRDLRQAPELPGCVRARWAGTFNPRSPRPCPRSRPTAERTRSRSEPGTGSPRRRTNR